MPTILLCGETEGDKNGTEIAVADFSRWILDAHLSRPWALAHNDFLVCGYFWRIVVHVQHLDGNRNMTEEAGVVWSRERERERERERMGNRGDESQT